MNKRLANVQRTFIVSIVGLVLTALFLLVGTLLVTNIARYDQQVSASNISELTRSYPEVTEYLNSQKPAEPHFVTIATLVKQSQEKALWRIVVIAAIPITVASAVIGVLISRRLLKPVADSYEAQERFIQDAAHELRNPLAAMSATLETAQLPQSLHKQDLSQTLARLERQTKRLIQINEDLLFLQKIQTNSGQSCNMSELTRLVVSNAAPSIGEKKLVVSVKVPKEITYKMSQKDYEIVIRNLLDNAIKYTSEGGRILVSLTKSDKVITLNVQDTGVGIPAKDLHHITKRFYRASNTNDAPGSGLGLALVEKVVDAYNAEMTIKSKLGKGTKITVSFR